MKTWNDPDVLESLQSRECPGCGGRKTTMRSFCPRDYYALTAELRQALYRRFGEGYAQAFVAALQHLGVEAELGDV